MPSLERALALEQRHDLVAIVGEDLDLDMTGTRDETLDVERAVAERAFGVAAGRIEGGLGVLALVDFAHPDATATGGRLHEHREPHALGGGQ